MQKVQIQIFGKDALVDRDQVRLLQKKQVAVKEAQRLQELLPQFRTGSEQRVELQCQLEIVSGQIISLNARIRKNVQFI